MNCFLLVHTHTKYVFGVARLKGKMEPVGNIRCDTQVTNDEVRRLSEHLFHYQFHAKCYCLLSAHLYYLCNLYLYLQVPSSQMST